MVKVKKIFKIKFVLHQLISFLVLKEKLCNSSANFSVHCIVIRPYMSCSLSFDFLKPFVGLQKQLINGCNLVFKMYENICKSVN